ncbi:RIBOSE-5-PHOSPHATE ISOMERASE B [Salix purpurea]|uniref:RIBOSE-5-PHOSPHATE ISOMERASE B n=1 Tax=Salix purpurea TaxID=77065 RepID=A0A9Q0W4L7_SALPP|nr:RIBOSE-5-PHOSPHATE ISOMERASE B [Salix purpurea]
MVRPPWCDKLNGKRGPWTADEDSKMLAHVAKHGTGNWTAVFSIDSLSEMPVIGTNLSDPKQEEGSINASACALCCLVKNRKLDPIEIIPGGAMKIVRESPTSAIVSFKAGSVEPAHHHTFGHDLVVLKGSKRVWNLSKKAKYDLVVGDYLFTPAGDVHRVKYLRIPSFLSSGKGSGTFSLMKRWRLLRVKFRRKQMMGLSW